MNIAKYLKANQIVFLDTSERNETLKALVAVGVQEGVIENPAKFYKAVLDREEIISTGIGMGVAIPHAKLSDFADFFIVMGILKKGNEWNALDGAPVRIVFLIGGPENRQTEYLKILSTLTSEIKDESKRKKILTLKSEDAILELF